MTILGYKCILCKQIKPVYDFQFRDNRGEITLFACLVCHSEGSEKDCIAVCPCTSNMSACVRAFDSTNSAWRNMAYLIALRNNKDTGRAGSQDTPNTWKAYPEAAFAFTSSIACLTLTKFIKTTNGTKPDINSWSKYTVVSVLILLQSFSLLLAPSTAHWFICLCLWLSFHTTCKDN